MKRITFTLLCVVLLTFSTHLLAQEENQSKLLFFTHPRTSLLFQANRLDLNSYEGGIGIGFGSSENMYWRTSLGFTFDNSGSDYENSPASIYSSSHSDNSYSFGAAVAPMFLLHQDAPAFVFFSPLVRASYGFHSGNLSCPTPQESTMSQVKEILIPFPSVAALARAFLFQNGCYSRSSTGVQLPIHTVLAPGILMTNSSVRWFFDLRTAMLYRFLLLRC